MLGITAAAEYISKTCIGWGVLGPLASTVKRWTGTRQCRPQHIPADSNTGFADVWCRYWSKPCGRASLNVTCMTLLSPLYSLTCLQGNKTPAASFNRGGSINIFVKHVERCLYNTMYISHFYTPSDTFNVFNSNTYCTVRPLFNVVELVALSFNPSPPCYFQRTCLTPFNGSLNILIPPHSCSVQQRSTSR